MIKLEVFIKPKNLIIALISIIASFGLDANPPIKKGLPQAVWYYNQAGNLVPENNPSYQSLEWLYHNKIGEFLARPIFTSEWLNKFIGWFMNTHASTVCIKKFVSNYKINTKECAPLDTFKTFNDFFSRQLNTGARPIDEQAPAIAPADGKLFVVENVNEQTIFNIKNRTLDLATFLNNQTLAKEYHQGLLMIFRITPGDYHRFHFPFDCDADKAKPIAGTLESVNPVAYTSNVQPLENKRHLIALNSKQYGKVLMIPVGAMGVGSIEEIYTPGAQSKGVDAGYFKYGGSTVALLFKKGTINPLENALVHSRAGYETEIKMGQRISQ